MKKRTKIWKTELIRQIFIKTKPAIETEFTFVKLKIVETQSKTFTSTNGKLLLLILRIYTNYFRSKIFALLENSKRTSSVAQM